MEDANIAREYEGVELWLQKAKLFARSVRNKLPYFVWRGQQIDIRITFPEDRLISHNMVGAVFELQKGHLPKIREMFEEIGIEFDHGLSCEGRDWEWDWSLKGPVKVTFLGHRKDTNP